jgi:hypothetical protein
LRTARKHLGWYTRLVDGETFRRTCVRSDAAQLATVRDYSTGWGD